MLCWLLAEAEAGELKRWLKALRLTGISPLGRFRCREDSEAASHNRPLNP